MAVKQLFLLLSLFMTVLAKSYNRGNVCTLHQGDCSYKITLIDSQCRNGMLNDGTANVLPVDYGNQYKYNKIDAFLPEDDEEPNNEQVDNAVTIKKLDELEKRLIKMMEGLSVRSLRHIRQIRNDLHQMSTSMSLLKAGGLKGKGRRSAKIDCPPEFIRVGMWNSCYRFSTFAESWHNAREYCSAFSADLVALDTIKESYILDYLIKSNRGKLFIFVDTFLFLEKLCSTLQFLNQRVY